MITSLKEVNVLIARRMRNTMIRKVCSWKCFSLGFHVDFRQKYIDLHIWNYFLSTSDGKYSDIPEPISTEFYNFQMKNRDAEDKFLKDKLGEDWHPMII